MIFRDHGGNVSFAEKQHGLVPLYATVSNEDEWDDFEWSHKMKIEQEAELHPDDSDLAEKLKRSREWRDAYLRWGARRWDSDFICSESRRPYRSFDC